MKLIDDIENWNEHIPPDQMELFTIVNEISPVKNIYRKVYSGAFDIFVTTADGRFSLRYDEMFGWDFTFSGDREIFIKIKISLTDWAINDTELKSLIKWKEINI